MNKIPIIMNGAVTVRIITRLVPTDWLFRKLLLKTNGVAAIPSREKIIPPTSSHFHAMTRNRVRTNEGIR